jgi:TrmH family RNA methyltransferase
MSSPYLLPTSAPAADTAVLDRLEPVGPGHPDPRRYSRARRNVLPRADRVVAVAGGWSHEVVLESGALVESLLWCPGDGVVPQERLSETAAACATVARSARRISDRTLGRIHPGLTAPALLSVVRLPRWEPVRVLSADARLVLVADGIEYAGNLGTLVRTADACAADAVILTGAGVRVTHPKAFVASRGTLLTVPVLEYDAVPDARRDLADAGFTAYLADPTSGLSYREAGLGSRRTAVVVGSEGSGPCTAWRDGGLPRVSIPMRGRSDSLNVAVSAAVLLFEARAGRDGA